jgi:hypothetical protein
MTRVLKIDRRTPRSGQFSDICNEDPTVYSPQDVVELLDMVHEGNRYLSHSKLL